MKYLAAGYLFAGLLAIAGVYGWIANIVKVIHTCCEPTGILVVRIIGIFLAPLGAVLGYC